MWLSFIIIVPIIITYLTKPTSSTVFLIILITILIISWWLSSQLSSLCWPNLHAARSPLLGHSQSQISGRHSWPSGHTLKNILMLVVVVVKLWRSLTPSWYCITLFDIVSSDLCLLLSNLRAVQSASQSVEKKIYQMFKTTAGLLKWYIPDLYRAAFAMLAMFSQRANYYITIANYSNFTKWLQIKPFGRKERRLLPNKMIFP